jgi:predicted protein tyrosine phosphatase
MYSPVAAGYQHAVIVRITSLPDFIPLAHFDEYEAVLCFKFDDMTEKTFNSLPAAEVEKITLFDDHMASVIVEFYRQWKDTCDVFVVHCDAGVSRSSAVAIALAEYSNNLVELDRLTETNKFWPNPHVWSIIRRVTGWDTARQHEFEELFLFVEGVHAHMEG